MTKYMYKIPNIVFYNPPNKNNIYRMIDLKRSAFIGEMSVAKRKDLYIQYFNIEPYFRRLGFGKRFLNFAVNLSKRMGLGGNLRVMASLTENDLSNAPHIFYRKYGFTSDNKKVLNKIDQHIRNNTQPSPFDFPITIMYYKNNKISHIN